MSNKSFSSLFNDTLENLLNKITTKFPEDVDLLLAKKTTENIRKINPTLLVKIWHSLVTLPYQTPILAGNIDYFLDKDYTEDIQKLQNFQQLGFPPEKILHIIDRLRAPIKSLSTEEKKEYTLIIIQLTKISILQQSGSQKTQH